MLDGLALAYVEAQECLYRAGVTEPCNTLLHNASVQSAGPTVRRFELRGDKIATDCARQQHRKPNNREL